MTKSILLVRFLKSHAGNENSRSTICIERGSAAINTSALRRLYSSRSASNANPLPETARPASSSKERAQLAQSPAQKTYTPRVKKVLALANKEAKALNHTYVGTEHILLGLLLEGDGVAARVLKNLDVDIEQTRQEILKELDPNFAAQDPGNFASPGACHQSLPQSTPTHVRD